MSGLAPIWAPARLTHLEDVDYDTALLVEAIGDQVANGADPDEILRSIDALGNRLDILAFHYGRR